MSIFQEENKQVEQQQDTSSASTSVNSSVNDNAQTQSQAEPFADLLGTVLNDRGEQKYKSVPEAMKGLHHAQNHIGSLEQKVAELEAELSKRSSVQDQLDQFTQSQSQESQAPAGLDEAAVVQLLEGYLNKKEAVSTAQANTQRVVQAMQQKFGEKAEESFYGKAKELGMTPEQFNQLSSQSPDAVLALFGGVQTQTHSPSRGSYHIPEQPRKEIPTIMDGGEERISLPAGESSVLMGATSEEMAAEFRRHKEAVYAKYGITD